MMKIQETKTKSLFGNHNIVYLGSHIFSAAMNMSIDEALMLKSAQSKSFYLRFYEFERPAIVLSKWDHHSAIKEKDGVDVCRRMSGGRPLYIDGNMLAYTLTGPISDFNENLAGSVDRVHREIGPMLARTISEMIGKEHEVTLGGSSSIRVDNRRIVGNAYEMGHVDLSAKNTAFMYQGIIVTAPWNVRKISNLLNLTGSDLEKISSLPNLMELCGSKRSLEEHKQQVIDGFVREFPKENFGSISASEWTEVMKSANSLYKERYSQDSWTYNDDIKPRNDVRFCILYED